MIPVVLYGQTGCGKTSLLRELHKRNQSVIDLEYLARHRGSVFGQINIPAQQPSQVLFEESIQQHLENGYGNDFVFIEHEAMNIGKLRLPDTVIQLYRNGLPVLVKASFEQRVINILQEYLPADPLLFIQSLEKLKKRLEPAFYNVLHKMLAEEQYRQFCCAILQYYDQAKQYHHEREYAFILNDNNVTANAEELFRLLRHHVVASERTTGSVLS